jgi:hypothetical protein
VTVSISISSLQGEKIAGELPPEELFFDVNAKLDEQKRTGKEVVLSFNLVIGTRPNAAKYAIAGLVSLEGEPQEVNKRLEKNPKTNVPQILFVIYQHVFSAIYMLSSILKIPYPPPDLLHPMQEKIQIVPQTPEAKPAQNQPEKPSEVVQETVNPELTTKTVQEENAGGGEPSTAPQAASSEGVPVAKVTGT